MLAPQVRMISLSPLRRKGSEKVFLVPTLRVGMGFFHAKIPFTVVLPQAGFIMSVVFAISLLIFLPCFRLKIEEFSKVKAVQRFKADGVSVIFGEVRSENKSEHKKGYRR
jgi:hypothetical protein